MSMATWSSRSSLELSDPCLLAHRTVSNRSRSPCERTARLIFCHSRLEEVLLFPQVNRFAHPGKRIFRSEFDLQADAFEAAVGDVADILPEQSDVKTENPARQAVFGVGDFQLHCLLNEVL